MNWNHGQQEIIFHWRINCLSSYVTLGTGVGTGAGTQDLDNQRSHRHRNRGNTNDNYNSRTASRPSRSYLYLKGAIPPPRANIVPQASVCFPLSVRGHFCERISFSELNSCLWFKGTPQVNFDAAMNSTSKGWGVCLESRLESSFLGQRQSAQDQQGRQGTLLIQPPLCGSWSFSPLHPLEITSFLSLFKSCKPGLVAKVQIAYMKLSRETKPNGTKPTTTSSQSVGEELVFGLGLVLDKMKLRMICSAPLFLSESLPNLDSSETTGNSLQIYFWSCCSEGTTADRWQKKRQGHCTPCSLEERKANIHSPPWTPWGSQREMLSAMTVPLLALRTVQREVYWLLGSAGWNSFVRIRHRARIEFRWNIISDFTLLLLRQCLWLVIETGPWSSMEVVPQKHKHISCSQMLRDLFTD